MSSSFECRIQLTPFLSLLLFIERKHKYFVLFIPLHFTGYLPVNQTSPSHWQFGLFFLFATSSCCVNCIFKFMLLIVAHPPGCIAGRLLSYGFTMSPSLCGSTSLVCASTFPSSSSHPLSCRALPCSYDSTAASVSWLLAEWLR